MRRKLPVRTPSTIAAVPGEALKVPAPPSRSAEVAAGDDEPLDFTRPLADRAESHVPVVLLHGKVLDETVAAVDLDRPLRRPDRHLGSVELRLRGEARDLFAGVLGRGRAEGQEPCGIDLRRHVGEVELDRLEFRDRLYTLTTPLCVPQRRLVRSPGDSEGERGDRD